MPENSNKSFRLGKCAREFNVSKDTIIEFLGKKGFRLECSPNTTFTEEMYTILVKEFESGNI